MACKTLHPPPPPPPPGCSMRTTKVQGRTSKSFDEVFGNLIAQGMSTDQLHNAVCQQVSSPMLSSRPLLNPAGVGSLLFAGVGDYCLSLEEHACCTAAAALQPEIICVKQD